MSNFLISFLAFIVAIGILVTFHEFGHFWTARRLGVKVLRFSIGFGKPLWTFKDKKGTEFVLAAIPLGGYVKMLDEREAPVPESEKKYAFNQKPVWARILIVFAGPLFNFIFAVFAYWLMFMIGISGWVPQIGEVTPGSIAARAGVVAGEEIVSIDNQLTKTWQQIAKQLMNRIGDKDTLEMQTKETDGIRTHYLNLSDWELKGERPDLLRGLGIEPYQPPIPPVVFEVMPDEPAHAAGVLPEDVIVAVNGKPIQEWKNFTDIVIKSIDRPIQLTVKRHEETKELTVTPRAKEGVNGEMIGFAGLVVKTVKLPEELIRKERLGPIDAFFAATHKTQEYIVISFKLIGKMVVGELGLKTLSGPITIAQGAGASMVVGLQYYLGFLALISISLGVLNLLPIPILDGGHLLYYVIEGITGKPVPDHIQVYGFKVGLMLLIFLMTVAFYNDLLRLF